MIKSSGTATQFINELKKMKANFTVKMTTNSTEVIYDEMKFLWLTVARMFFSSSFERQGRYQFVL